MSIDASGVNQLGSSRASIDSMDCLLPVSHCDPVGAADETVAGHDCGCVDPVTSDPSTESAGEVSCMDTITRLLEVVVAIVTALAPSFGQNTQTSTQTPPISPDSGQSS